MRQVTTEPIYAALEILATPVSPRHPNLMGSIAWEEEREERDIPVILVTQARMSAS